MPQPRLLKPALTVIEAIDKANTKYDRQTREPIGNVARIRYEIEAQHTNVHRQVPQYSQGGVDEQVRGWYTILTEDASAIGYVPLRGDKVTMHGHDETEVYVVNVEFTGSWEDGSTLIRLYYSDRRPAAAGPNRG